MPLARQKDRDTTGGRIYESTWRRRRRRRVRRLLLVLLVVGVVALAVTLWPKGAPVGGGARPPIAGLPPAATQQPEPLSPTRLEELFELPPPTPDSPPPKPVEPPPPVDPPPPAVKPVDPPPPLERGVSTLEQTRLVAAGRQLAAAGQLVEARRLLSEALAGGLPADEAAALRDEVGRINADLVFSPKVTEGDPHAETYVVKAGEVLSRVAPVYHVPWRFLARINGISDPRRVRAGARIKVVKGPFHVVMHKRAFRADVYLGAPGGDGIFVRSFRVGIGEYDSTPEGLFIVKRHSKLINPPWTNPRTGKSFQADDPKNPLGERWVGLRGAEESTADLTGYGLHGTIQPDSIGREASMGCIRMMPDDIALLFDMLEEEESLVVVK